METNIQKSPSYLSSELTANKFSLFQNEATPECLLKLFFFFNLLSVSLVALTTSWFTDTTPLYTLFFVSTHRRASSAYWTWSRSAALLLNGSLEIFDMESHNHYTKLVKQTLDPGAKSTIAGCLLVLKYTNIH